MRCQTVILFVFVSLTCLVFGTNAADTPPKGTYTTRYDHIDVDAILKSSRLLRSYMKCALDKGPCTREGQELRKNLPDAIETDCTRCSAKQKEWAGKILAWLLQYEKGYFDQLIAKYDPQGKFAKRFHLDDTESNEDDTEY